jgi:hypothetical protein
MRAAPAAVTEALSDERMEPSAYPRHLARLVLERRAGTCGGVSAGQIGPRCARLRGGASTFSAPGSAAPSRRHHGYTAIPREESPRLGRTVVHCRPVQARRLDLHIEETSCPPTNRSSATMPRPHHGSAEDASRCSPEMRTRIPQLFRTGGSAQHVGRRCSELTRPRRERDPRRLIQWAGRLNRRAIRLALGSAARRLGCRPCAGVRSFALRRPDHRTTP